MATKETHSKASIAYNKRQDNIMIRPTKEIGAKIREAAAAQSMSVQGYILQTLYARTGAKGNGVIENIESEHSTPQEISCVLSPDREKILRDIIKDAVLNTPADSRGQLETMLSQIVKEVVDENSTSMYQTLTESLV